MAYLPNLAFQPYVAPQQDLPVEEFNALGTTLNQRYDQNIAKWDELDAYTHQLQLNDVDKGIKDSALADTRNILKSIRENGNWENSKLQVREVAKRLANDTALQVGQQNFKKAQEQQDTENKMRQQGINLVNFNPDRFSQTTIDPATGRARALDYSGTEKLQDFDTRRKSLFEGVTADGYGSESSSPVFDKATGAIYQVGSGSEAKFVTAKKIKDIANRNLGNYLETAEGQQELKLLTTRNSMNATPLPLADAKKQILSGIINTGLTRVFNQSSSKSTNSIVSLGNIGAQPNQPPPNTQMEGTQIEGNVANPIFASIAEKTSADARRTAHAIAGPAWGNAGVGASNTRYDTTGGKGTFESLNSEEQTAFKKIAIALNINSKNGKYSNEDIGKIQKFAADRSNTGVGLSVRTFTEDEIGKAKNYAANGNYRGRQFYSQSDKKFLTYDELPKDAKEKLESGETKGIQFQGVVDTDNPFSDMAKHSKKFNDTKGWVSPESIAIGGKQYIVSSSLSDKSKQDINFRELSQTISRAGRTGVPMYLGKGNDRELIVPAGTGLYQLKKPDGSLVSPKSFTKEQLALYSQTYNLQPED